MLRSIAAAQELAQLNVRQSTTRRGIGLMDDKSMAVGRFASEKPRVAIWAAIEFTPVRHKGSLFCGLVTAIGRLLLGPETEAPASMRRARCKHACGLRLRRPWTQPALPLSVPFHASYSGRNAALASSSDPVRP
jgi:hypothetical protein